MYLVGKMPWDTGVVPPELVDLVEGPEALPAGRALDLGCGTGTNVVYLARHGWDATGVDYTPRAISRARRKASEAGVSPKLVVGDVTRLRELGVGEGFSLLIDLGCFHGLSDEQRDAYVREVNAVATPTARYLISAFPPGHGGPGPRGASREEIERRFEGWELAWEHAPQAEGSGTPERRSVTYLLLRRGEG